MWLLKLSSSNFSSSTINSVSISVVWMMLLACVVCDLRDPPHALEDWNVTTWPCRSGRVKPDQRSLSWALMRHEKLAIYRRLFAKRVKGLEMPLISSTCWHNEATGIPRGSIDWSCIHGDECTILSQVFIWSARPRLPYSRLHHYNGTKKVMIIFSFGTLKEHLAGGTPIIKYVPSFKQI